MPNESGMEYGGHFDFAVKPKPEPESDFDRLKLQVEAFLFWFNSDGSPCDGPRFREEQAKLRAMVTHSA